FGGQLASLCVDTAHSGQVLRYPALADRADAAHPYFGRFRAWAGLPCEFWVLRDHDAFTGPWRQRTTAAVLVVGTRFGPATPYRQTQPYADLLPDARVVTLNGWGHTSLGKSRCVDDAVAGIPAH
ncbi:MAG: alpha/beta hydrolase, partial [Dermatophilaceae bacterium]